MPRELYKYMAEEYTYAVARIRALENSLLTGSAIEQLISCQNEEQCLHFLEEKGWGDADTAADSEAILAREEEKIWEVVKDLHIDMKYFDVLSLPKEFHNLKAAVKEAATGPVNAGIYYEDTAVSGRDLAEKIRERDFDSLPDSMRYAAEEAYDTLLHTGDGQLCDIIIDKACLEAVRAAGREAGRKGYRVIEDYAENAVCIADIKTAIRAARTGKSLDFLMKALVDTGSFSAAGLARAAAQGEDSVKEFLMTTDYRDAAESLSESPSAFERWCDDRVIESLQPQKYETFTIGPVIAYVIARQNEIKTVRLVLTGKANGLPDEEIRERVRQMYV